MPNQKRFDDNQKQPEQGGGYWAGQTGWWLLPAAFFGLASILLLGVGIWFSATFGFPIGSWNIPAPASSMKPAFEVGDYFIAERWTYSRRSPRRGELVIFRLPDDPHTNWIKRVVGLPGDTIQMKDGKVILNGKRLRYEDISKRKSPKQYSKGKLLREYMPSGKSYIILDTYPAPRSDNPKKFVVPAKNYFVMGDHRDNSNDSRFNLGYIPQANIHSKPLVFFLSRNFAKIGTVPQ